MSLFDRLSAIENKPYQPVYSANIPKKTATFVEESSLKKQRPKTTSALRTTSSARSVYSRPTTTTSRLSRIDTKSIADKDDGEEVESVNLSLLSVGGSEEHVVNRDKYGKFQYFSYFERYMNRRAMVKIPLCLMPKKQGEIDENNPDPTIFELLDEYEQKLLFMQYDVDVARPPRLRSNSVPNGNRRGEIIPKNVKAHKTTSLDRLVVDERCENKSIKKQEENRLQHHDENDGFDVRGIKAPDTYSLGTRKMKVNETVKKEKRKKTLYSHIESKLAAYFGTNRKPVDSNTIDPNESKNALIQHDLYKKEFVVYKKKQDPDPNSERVQPTLAECYLKMGGDLEDRIRADMKVNRGPIYFVQLTEENLNVYDQRQTKKTILISDKYYYIYEWLKSMDENECQHFYTNPFVLDKMCSTDELTLQSFRNSEDCVNNVKCIGIAATTTHKIDPFDNPTYQTFVEKLPTNKYRRSKSGYVVTHDKQTFISTKDYKSMLRFDTNFSLAAVSNKDNNNKESIVSSSSSLTSSKQKLKKQKDLNDILFARTQLNLFIL